MKKEKEGVNPMKQKLIVRPLVAEDAYIFALLAQAHITLESAGLFDEAQLLRERVCTGSMIEALDAVRDLVDVQPSLSLDSEVKHDTEA